MTLNSLSWPLAEWMTARRATLIWLVVSVPVLSEQITVVQPSVSTDGRLHRHHQSLFRDLRAVCGLQVLIIRSDTRTQVSAAIPIEGPFCNDPHVQSLSTHYKKAQPEIYRTANAAHT